MHTSEPLIAGNTVLKPGIYVWKLMDSQADRHIVQISDKKTGHVQTTILAIPAYREEVSSENIVQFWETPSGAPRAVRKWFYPGDNFGQEFAYPKGLKVLVAGLRVPRTGLQQRPLLQQQPPSPTKVENVPSAVVKPQQVVAATTKASGSWAIISDTAARKRNSASANPEATGVWEKIKKLPLTATVAPLIGLIGISSLLIFLMTYLKRQRSPSR